MADTQKILLIVATAVLLLVLFIVTLIGRRRRAKSAALETIREREERIERLSRSESTRSNMRTADMAFRLSLPPRALEEMAAEAALTSDTQLKRARSIRSIQGVTLAMPLRNSAQYCRSLAGDDTRSLASSTGGGGGDASLLSPQPGRTSLDPAYAYMDPRRYSGSIAEDAVDLAAVSAAGGDHGGGGAGAYAGKILLHGGHHDSHLLSPAMSHLSPGMSHLSPGVSHLSPMSHRRTSLNTPPTPSAGLHVHFGPSGRRHSALPPLVETSESRGPSSCEPSEAEDDEKEELNDGLVHQHHHPSSLTATGVPVVIWEPPADRPSPASLATNSLSSSDGSTDQLLPSH
ncbi:hypothetical protein BC828DRAFT_387089 [Blastocladiella britannica]|nr:hypothetical protein BC828DRAFT_387089 [Blastocladiella britannica]